jgi:hypothetical protein
MEDRIKKIEEAIEAIQKRNISVENNKAWERSSIRILSISIITYIVAISILYILHAPHIFLNACIPVCGFILSTQSLPSIKKIWLKNK